MVQKKYLAAEAMYARIKEEVCQRALALDEAVSQSTQVHFWGAGQPRPAADPKASVVAGEADAFRVVSANCWAVLLRSACRWKGEGV